MIRLVVISATIALLICMWIDRPKPIKSVQVDYCWIDQRFAFQDEDGKWIKLWGKGFGPCSQLDRYENI